VPLTVRVLIGLVLGFAVGFVANAVTALASVPVYVEPVGTLFINGIRMTVIPLVVASLIVGVAAAPDARTIGRLGGRALAWFIAVLVVAATLGALVAPIAFSVITPDPAKADALRANAAVAIESAKSVPTFIEWVVSLVPTNPMRAAADGAMLPLILFSLLFGVALTRIAPERRAPVVRFCEALQAAAFVLVRWILELAPIGVFALTVPLAARLGLSAAGAVAWYIGVVSAVCVAFILLVLYPLASIGGRVSLSAFAKAALPVQMVAISSRSSMASLPVMIEEFAPRLGLTKEVTGFFLALSSTVFRTGAGIGITTGFCFIAALFGVHLTAVQLATAALTTVLLSFSVPGIPNGSIIIMVPVLLAAGLPADGVGILIALDTIPDMFRTTTNVTGTLAVAVVLNARE
jgi:Na+/H+-dicarboxylate symporter